MLHISPPFSTSEGKDCVEAEEARQLLRQAGIEAGPEIELGPTHYRCIAHNPTEQVLVFTPVVGIERRLVVLLGPITDEPRIVLLQLAADGSWIDLLDSGAYLL